MAQEARLTKAKMLWNHLHSYDPLPKHKAELPATRLGQFVLSIASVSAICDLLSAGGVTHNAAGNAYRQRLMCPPLVSEVRI